MMLHFNQMEYRRGRRDMAETIGALIGIIVVLVILLLSPFATIWALNTLFPVQIEYGFYTYVATLWLTSLVAVRYRNKA